MKVLGFGVIVLGLIMVYIGVTGSQHNLMSIIKNGPVSPSGQNLNPSGTGATSGSGGSSTKNPGGNQQPGPEPVTID